MKNRFFMVKLKLLIKNVKIGKNFSYERDVSVKNEGNIEIGDNVEFAQGVHLASYAKGAKITIGANSFIARYTMLCAYDKIEVGQNCMIAPFCYISDFNHNYDSLDVPIKSQPNKITPVIIEDDVWIGAGASVLPGVTIGKGSVIGARAVVNESIPPYSIAVGIPAKIIKNRLELQKPESQNIETINNQTG